MRYTKATYSALRKAGGVGLFCFLTTDTQVTQQRVASFHPQCSVGAGIVNKAENFITKHNKGDLFKIPPHPMTSSGRTEGQ